MKCDESLPLMEEYLDGELTEPVAAQLSAHLSACTDCAGEFAVLVREQELYAGYRRELEVTPALWQGVSARIEAEKAASSSSLLTRWQAWLARTFANGTTLRPAYAAAALFLFALGLTALGLIVYRNLGQSGQLPLAQVEAARQQQLKNVELTNPPVKSSGPEMAVAPSQNEKRTEAPARVHERQPQKDFVANASTARKREREPLELTPDAAPPSETMTAVNMPQPAGDANQEISRHVEKAQMLLRSFRNVRLAETSHAPDIAYEKESARKLLYRNIVLRREAATQGNTPAEKILTALEPILLDIANLPQRATARDVRNIERRMRRKEIIATLQIHSLIAQNSY